MSKKSTLGKISRNKAPDAADPDNPHLGAAQLRAMKRVAPIKRIRWQLGLSQEDFARRFEIPIGTLRDWEQGRSNPDRPALAYLKVIGSDPEFVGQALRSNDAVKSRIEAIASKALSTPASLTEEEIKNLAASVLSTRLDARRSRKAK